MMANEHIMLYILDNLLLDITKLNNKNISHMEIYFKVSKYIENILNEYHNNIFKDIIGSRKAIDKFAKAHYNYLVNTKRLLRLSNYDFNTIKSKLIEHNQSVFCLSYEELDLIIKKSLLTSDDDNNFTNWLINEFKLHKKIITNE